ncbi:ankyrin repeat-containing protein BDA1-like [Arachis stenosperma]|uniref:ankyrin repeat-containing protein BDA1-like n=1 Tax=Arachis stenosperma TaxID=217475 RepID=UPI0025AB881A|nr:ankyrin repeat-containing protein BDA1-like [Arachis stenosperma]
MANNVSPLEEAALSGDIDRLYALIQGDPDILNDADAKPFVSTPLHIAASVDLRTNPELELKYLYFATEIMVLMPSFALKLNQQGFSPVHLAIQNGHSKLARRFVDMNKELARVKGREGTTPLHLVSQIGDCDLLTFFLSACPDSIEDVNARDETALHVAVRYEQFDALRVLVGWLKGNTRKGAARLERSMLNWRDVAGNTILHLSVIKHDIQALDFLLKDRYIIDLNVKNSENKTALDEATGRSEDMKSKLSKAGARLGTSLEDSSMLAAATSEMYKILDEDLFETQTIIRRIRGNISDNQRDAYLVAATLILTTVYQSALSPPGGLYQADASNLNATSSLNSAASKSVLSTVNFASLALINSSALFYAIIAFLVIIPEGMIGGMLVAPSVYVGISYFYSLAIISPPRHETTGHPIAGQVMLLIVIIFSGIVIALLLNGFGFGAYLGTTQLTALEKYMPRLPRRFTSRNNNASNI